MTVASPFVVVVVVCFVCLLFGWGEGGIEQVKKGCTLLEHMSRERA